MHRGAGHGRIGTADDRHNAILVVRLLQGGGRVRASRDLSNGTIEV